MTIFVEKKESFFSQKRKLLLLLLLMALGPLNSLGKKNQGQHMATHPSALKFCCYYYWLVVGCCYCCCSNASLPALSPSLFGQVEALTRREQLGTDDHSLKQQQPSKRQGRQKTKTAEHTDEKEKPKRQSHQKSKPAETEGGDAEPDDD